MDRDQVVRALREIAALMRIRGESEYRIRAYEVAAQRLAQVQGDFREMVERGTLTDIPGIGKGLSSHITELARTGTSQQLDELHAEFPPGIVELLKLPSFGPKKAVLLWKELGAGDLDSLEQACREGRVRNVKGFAAKTEAKLLEAIVALKATPEQPEARLLGHALPLSHDVLKALRDRARVRRAELAGGVRRARDEVDDAAIVVAAVKPAEVLALAAQLPMVAKVAHEDRRSVAVRLFDRDLLIEVIAVPPAEFASALLFATGAKAHVDRLVAIAERRGLSLTPEGLFRGETRIDTPEEAAIYAALDLDFVPPELREDRGELDAAAKGRVPRLIEEPEIAGIVHSHSTWSDGGATLEEMALAAKAKGLRYLTVTEHSPTASYAGGVTTGQLHLLWDEIDALNERLDGFRLLKGVESDILPDGSLDYPDELLARMDLVIGSVHARHQMDEDAMTRRIVGALKNPRMNILGHATGRLIQRRDPYKVRMDEIIETAARYGVVIEVNGSPHRLDLKAEYVRQALDAGVKIVCSTDSHSMAELDNVTYAVATARRGGATRADVLNTLEADEFLAALRALKRNAQRARSGEDATAESARD